MTAAIQMVLEIVYSDPKTAELSPVSPQAKSEAESST